MTDNRALPPTEDRAFVPSASSPQAVSPVPASIPSAIAEGVLRMGKVEWGAVGPKTDDEHLEDFRGSLEKTREHFGTEGPQRLHGLYLEGTETVLCHTGTSPNSALNARALAGIWNWLVEQCAAQGIETGTAETVGLGAKHESPVGSADAPESQSND